MFARTVLLCSLCVAITMILASSGSARPVRSGASDGLGINEICATLKAVSAADAAAVFVEKLSGGRIARANALLVAVLGAGMTHCSQVLAKARSAVTLGMNSLFGTAPPVDIPPLVFGPRQAVRSDWYVYPNGTVGVSSYWSAFDSDGIGSYDLRLRTNGSWGTTNFADGLAASRTLVLTPGNAYQFAIKATDRRGASSDFSYGPSFSLNLLDESTASFSSGWYRYSWADALGGLEYDSSTPGTTATSSFVGNYVAWLGPKFPGGGTARVVIDGRLAETVSTYSATTLPRRVLAAWQWPVSGAHTMTIEVASGRLDVDGFLVLG